MKISNIKWKFVFKDIDPPSPERLERRRFVLKKIEWKPEVSEYLKKAYGDLDTLFNETVSFLKSYLPDDSFILYMNDLTLPYPPRPVSSKEWFKERKWFYNHG